MREIKFRAWDSKREEWLDGEYHTMRFDGTNIKHKGGGIKNSVILMQFTGLCDKKGKEIYEGDVLKIKDDNIWQWSKLTKGFVDFEYCSFILRLVDDHGDTCELDTFSHVGDGTGDVYDPKKHELFEIIGNIYENPKLLK